MNARPCTVCENESAGVEEADPAAECQGLLEAPLPLCEDCRDYVAALGAEDSEGAASTCIVCGDEGSSGYIEIEGTGPGMHDAFYSGRVCAQCSSDVIGTLLYMAQRINPKTD